MTAPATTADLQAELARTTKMLNVLAGQRGTALDAVVNLTADCQIALAEADALRAANAVLAARLVELEQTVAELKSHLPASEEITQH